MPETSAYLELLKKTLTAAIFDESAWRVDGLAPAPFSIRELFRKLRRFFLRVNPHGNSVLIHKHPPPQVHDGRSWPLFGYSMIGMERINNLHACLDQILADNIPGDFLEAGVWRGGAAIFMRAFLHEHRISNRSVWLADSFAGLPAPTPRDRQTTDPDVSRLPFLQVSLDEVKKNFARFNLLDDQVRFLPGWFSQTLPSAPIPPLALLRIDADLYSSTRDALENLYPKLSPGGFVIIDDYHSWQGCRQALDEYRTAHGITTRMERIDWTAIFWRK